MYIIYLRAIPFKNGEGDEGHFFCMGELENAIFCMRGLENAIFCIGGSRKLAKFHPPPHF